MGRAVRTPWPTSDLPHQIFTPPSESSSSQALGENGAAAEGSEFLVFRGFPERKKGRSRLAPVAAEVFKKARRVTFEDMTTAPRNQTPRFPRREQAQLPSARAGSGGALGGGGGKSRPTPRQPTGRPPTASLTGRKRNTYINLG